MQQKIVIRVRLESKLEAIAGRLPAPARRKLATVYYRWAKQLWVSAEILEPQPRTAQGRRCVRPSPQQKHL